MGMSASQARLLSLTARMHDMEFQAQALQYTKLDLANSKKAVYDEYLDAMDSTKLQMAVVTPTGKEFQDITYTNMIMSNAGAAHAMYIITNMKTGQVLLPHQVAQNFRDEDIRYMELDEFLDKVATSYLYHVGSVPGGRTDLDTPEKRIAEMRKDGNYDYWKAVFYQIIGYEDENGVYVPGRGFCPISPENASDRDWLQDALNSGEVQLYKLTTEQMFYLGDKINIFAETNVATDPDLAEATNDEIIRQAEVKYERAMNDIDEKETKLDLKLAQIDTQHNALKTEYDSVKQIVSKNIDRSFKTFNA